MDVYAHRHVTYIFGCKLDSSCVCFVKINFNWYNKQFCMSVENVRFINTVSWQIFLPFTVVYAVLILKLQYDYVCL
jgi:hypothetical protein